MENNLRFEQPAENPQTHQLATDLQAQYYVVSEACAQMEDVLPLMAGDAHADTAAEYEEARRHIETCSACARELETLRETVRVLEELLEPPAAENVEAEVLAQIRSMEEPNRNGTTPSPFFKALDTVKEKLPWTRPKP